MRSDLMKKGLEKYPHRSLLKAMGLTDREIDQPIIGVANSYNEFIPGHIHLDKITQAVKAGVRMQWRAPPWSSGSSASATAWPCTTPA